MLAVCLVLLVCAGANCALGQEKPKVQLNVMNVCTPNVAEQAQLAVALEQITLQPSFGPDFEVARGRTTGEGVSDWVRLRREFRRDPVLNNVQYLLTESGHRVQQKIVFHTKASLQGEALQVSLESETGEAAAAAQALSSPPPPARIRLERFGGPSLVLARCPQAEQSVYEPLFRTAGERFAAYFAALDVKRLATAELESLHRTAAAPRK